MTKDYLRPNDDGTPREVRLRDGGKAWIAAISPRTDKLMGWFEADDGSYEDNSWFSNGRHLHGGDPAGQDDFDIIGPAPEWKEGWFMHDGNDNGIVCIIENRLPAYDDEKEWSWIKIRYTENPFDVQIID